MAGEAWGGSGGPGGGGPGGGGPGGLGAGGPGGLGAGRQPVAHADALAVALEAAAIAAAHIRAGLGTVTAREADTKSGPSDLVTIVDRAVESEVVALLQRRTPGVPVLGEEGGLHGTEGSPGTDRDRRQLWVLDPLDGTANFAHGIALSCFCLALLEDGCPVVGVIADPYRAETFSAVAGAGAWLEVAGARRRLQLSAGSSDSGRPVPDRDRPALDRDGPAPDRDGPALASAMTLLEVGGGWDFAHFHRVWAGLSAAGSSVRVLGSAGLALAYVAAGRATTLAFGRMQPWDIAAGLLLIEEAGGHVSGWDGPVDIMAGSPLLAAAAPEALAALRTLIRA